MSRSTRLNSGSASGSSSRYRAGSARRTAAGGRVSVTDSTTRRPSRSSERGSSHAHAHRAGMFRLAASRCCWSRVRLAVGVQRDEGAGEPRHDPGQRFGDLVFRQVGQHALGGEEVRSRAGGHYRRPRLVQDRRRDHPAAVGVGEEPAAELDRVGQVQVDPVHRAIVHPLETGVEAGADLHDRPGRMPGQERPHPGVEDRGAQDGDRPAGAPAVPGSVVVDRGRQLHGLRVAQHGPLPAGGPRPRGQGDEERLLDGAELGLVSVSHPVHETPRPRAACCSGCYG